MIHSEIQIKLSRNQRKVKLTEETVKMKREDLRCRRNENRSQIEFIKLKKLTKEKLKKIFPNAMNAMRSS